METKDGLTRSEVREAIKILAIREGNLDNVVISAMILLIAANTLFITLFAYNITTSNKNTSHSFVLDILNYLVVGGAVLIFIFILFRASESKSKGIEEKMKKLAKEHNLEEFLDAISDKK